jgi:hypothetical protein
MGRDPVARTVLKASWRATTAVIMFLFSFIDAAAPAHAQSDAQAAAREHFTKGVAAVRRGGGGVRVGGRGGSGAPLKGRGNVFQTNE